MEKYHYKYMGIPTIKDTYKNHFRLHGNKVHLFGDSRQPNRWWKCELCHKLTEQEKKAISKKHQ